MTPTLDERLETLGWSRRELARRLSVTPQAVNRWADGSAAFPAPVDAWLARIATTVRDALASDPPPARPARPE